MTKPRKPQTPLSSATASDDAPSDPIVEEPSVGQSTDGPPAATETVAHAPVFELFELPTTASDDEVQAIINRQIANDVESAELDGNYTVLVLASSISRSTSNRIYQSIRKAPRSAPVLLIVDSDGGDIAAAYLISKLCQQHTDRTFEVAVARRAKSAATLICCGADKIHMGSLSELGPIDPQFGPTPALAMKYSVEHIAELASKYPGAAGMFSDYLTKALPVQSLGFFERTAESAVQYATRLLDGRRVTVAGGHDVLAKRLVYFYKDHGFVIDSKEAAEIFESNVVSIDSKAYQLSNKIFESLDMARYACDSRLSRILSYVGDPSTGCLAWAK